MPLITGSSLGSYEIVGQLGSGGMGEVYRARDTKLGRQVAIKVLPEAVATDPERVARFEREAKVLASLNHPHIAALFGMEESEGRHFLVMELVEGETLADLVSVTPQPTFTVGNPVQAPRGSMRFGGQIRPVDMARDGRIIGVIDSIQAQGTPTTPQIRIVLNWMDELKELVPTR